MKLSRATFKNISLDRYRELWHQWIPQKVNFQLYIETLAKCLMHCHSFFKNHQLKQLLQRKDVEMHNGLCQTSFKEVWAFGVDFAGIFFSPSNKLRLFQDKRLSQLSFLFFLNNWNLYYSFKDLCIGIVKHRLLKGKLHWGPTL